MAFSLIDSKIAEGTNGATTAAMDTTASGGAKVITLVVSYKTSIGAPAMSDSQSNTYSARVSEDGPFDITQALYDTFSPSTNASHTFTITNASAFCNIMAMAWNETGTPTFDQSSHADADQPGSLTPANNNSLIVTGGLRTFTDVYTVPTNFTLLFSDADTASVDFGGGSGYEIQTTATARNPQWTDDGSGFGAWTTLQAIYAPGGGGGTVVQDIIGSGIIAAPR